MQTITRADFAKMLNVSRAAVTIAANNGRFTAEAMDGKKLKLPLALEQWKTNKDPRGLAPADDDEDDEEDLVDGTLLEARRRVARLRGDKLEIENAVTVGKLIGREIVERGLQDAGAKIAADLDGIAGWAEELANLATGDVGAMRAALKTKARGLREQIAGSLEKVTDGGSADDEDDADA